ncbi:hypothetical protein E2C01_033039 [Portunus trituberculatus]|uniref:Uncharacterized protein n=1 Tax=Portunus trituberculatus TaxID=210409 RepID=A0A5B7EXI1_PORTR|nr:hypothetical protein [Portunus trituberculatus]
MKPYERLIRRDYLAFSPFSSGTHFYLEICVRLDHFVDIKKGLWRSED